MRKKQAGYSMLEILITMAIFGIIITMLLQSLFLNVQLNVKINTRSKFNSDMDLLTSMIERDIRNADFFYNTTGPGSMIQSCINNSTPLVPVSACTLSLNGVQYLWTLKLVTLSSGTQIHQVQRWKFDPNAVPADPAGGVLDYASPESLNIVTISGAGGLEFLVNSFEKLNNNNSLANIMVTIQAQPANTVWTSSYGINPQIRQISVSTRNYEVKY